LHDMGPRKPTEPSLQGFADQPIAGGNLNRDGEGVVVGFVQLVEHLVGLGSNADGRGTSSPQGPKAQGSP
jgi:hypothetical protein